MDAACDIPGLIREPRSLWSVAQLDRASTNVLFTSFDREDFRNGSRWPITVDRFAVSPIGYAFVEHNPFSAAGDSFVEAVMLGARLRIAVPGRQFYARNPVPLAGFRACPTGPSFEYGGANSFGVGSYGTFYRKFDQPVPLPRNGTMQLDLSAVPAVVGGTGTVAMAFHELGTAFGGAARVARATLGTTATLSAPFTGEPPFPAAFAGEFIPGAPNTTNPWPPTSRFNARTFDAQESSRGSVAMTPITGMSVMTPYGGAATIFTCMGTRVQVSDGDSAGEYWWRPGAPLPLVFDTITTAAVYELPEPITLEPGDTFDVELSVRADVVGSPVATPNYIVGVSFNGYADIEA